MSESASQHPAIATVKALAVAVADKDKKAARALITEEGWNNRGDSGRKVFRNWAGDEITPVVISEIPGDGKCAVLAQQLRGVPPKSVGQVWLHLVEQEGAWLLEGFSNELPVTTLWLAGVIGSIFSDKDLAPSEEAAAWGEALMATYLRDPEALAEHVAPSPQADEALAELRKRLGGGTEPKVAGTAAMAFIGRFAVGFEVSGKVFGNTWWLVLKGSATGAPPEVIGGAERPSTMLFFKALSKFSRDA
jgi:hypothetical protein